MFIARRGRHLFPSSKIFTNQSIGRSMFNGKRFFTQRSPLQKSVIKNLQIQRCDKKALCTQATTSAGVNSIYANSSKSVKYWIAGGAALVYGIICVGGITRLTESGLSMVDWKFQGKMPPSTEEEWIAEFEKYKQFPEFKRLFPSMTVDEFKDIFFWEYLHRMWGRGIGLYIAAPFVYYAASRSIRGPMLTRSSLLLGGVVAQGLLGWWMVKSGLEEPEHDRNQPRVSQYRLAAHLGAALVLYSGMFWTAMDLFTPSIENINKTVVPQDFQKKLRVFRRSVAGTLALVFTTAISGAFVAGLDAGLAYNMFPFMEEGLLKAENAWNLRVLGSHFDSYGAWIKDNLFDNTAGVQFNHRVLAISSVSTISLLYWYSRTIAPYLPKSARLARHHMLGFAFAQVALGISTLLYLVPVELAACHQAGSVALLSSVMWMLHSLRRIR